MDQNSNITMDPDEGNMPTEENIVRAPFTEDQVRSMNQYQFKGVFHPFTCGNDNCRGRIYYGPDVTSSICLIATTDGWICGACGYTQDWAWNWMANWGWLEQVRQVEEWKGGITDEHEEAGEIDKSAARTTAQTGPVGEGVAGGDTRVGGDGDADG